VIDEAGQALEPACWIPILKTGKVVMAGDHCQLPPTIKSSEAARELGTTLLEKCVALHPEAVVLLEEQYRMHQTIMGFPSQEFYESRLRAHPSVAHRLLAPGEPPLLFVDTAGCGFEEEHEGTSISNGEEARFLVKQVVRLAQRLQADDTGAAVPTIAVIAPYKHQVEVLQQLVRSQPELQTLGAALSVNTIDSFQGQERDAIFISLTRSNAESTIGFLSEVRRMNVAMTRARKKLVVVGDSATLSTFPFYADFIAYAEAQDAYKSAWEFMDA
jgi:superfamily I DNA and/or RNA helicase